MEPTSKPPREVPTTNNGKTPGKDDLHDLERATRSTRSTILISVILNAQPDQPDHDGSTYRRRKEGRLYSHNISHVSSHSFLVL